MKMKKLILATACSLLIVALGTINVQASIVNVGDTISFSSPSYRTGNGGEFEVNRISPNAQSNLFRTFCVELTETIGFGTHYKVGGISTATVLSGKSLTTATAALYVGFRSNTGTILGQSYSYAGGTQQGIDGRALQLAIWHTMGWAAGNLWGTILDNEYNSNSKAQALVAAASVFNFGGGADSFGNVRIMNVVGADGTGNFQDQLTLVPEPGSFLIWSLVGMGLVFVVGSGRRRS